MKGGPLGQATTGSLQARKLKRKGPKLLVGEEEGNEYIQYARIGHGKRIEQWPSRGRGWLEGGQKSPTMGNG